MRNILFSMFILLSTIYANENSTQSNKYFVDAAVGITNISLDYNAISGSFSPIESSDKSGYNLAINLGYNYSKNTFSTIGYSYIKLSNIKLSNFLVSYNKRFLNMPYGLYGGLVGGVSYGTILKIPVANLPALDKTTTSYVYGAQLGSEYKLKNNLTFFTQFQYLRADNKINLISGGAKAEIHRDNIYSLMFGFRF